MFSWEISTSLQLESKTTRKSGKLKSALDKAAPRQAGQLNYTSQFSTGIKYIKGENNIVVDTLSRVTEVSSIDYDQIADAQTQDEELKSLQIITSLNLKEYPLPSGRPERRRYSVYSLGCV
ncbi:hypothetical protein AVEN_21797-1 [Araneus ventricosus]|uniref:Uncharacterized protein n=1 Tax=Araneus ventricosus TaxID=182803 RepID=A0A4Y2IQZ0_ARAVE|nr:hypothetical protein AVEN_21797-1 [Araneus ventricosus]